MSDAAKIRSLITAKQLEIKKLKQEEEAIIKLSSAIKDQLNRLKIEEMAFKNEVLNNKVKKACNNPTPMETDSNEQNYVASHDTLTSSTTQPQELVKLVNLDLVVPSTIGIPSNYEESSDDDDEANECLF